MQSTIAFAPLPLRISLFDFGLTSSVFFAFFLSYISILHPKLCLSPPVLFGSTQISAQARHPDCFGFYSRPSPTSLCGSGFSFLLFGFFLLCLSLFLALHFYLASRSVFLSITALRCSWRQTSAQARHLDLHFWASQLLSFLGSVASPVFST